LKLAMWEAVEMPERNWDREKKSWIDTGRKILQTQYHFRDEFGTVLTLLSKDEKYRELEGKNCDIQVKLTQSSYQGKSKVSLGLLSASLAKK